MAYRVDLTHRAERDLDVLYADKNAAGSQSAALWFNGLEKVVYTLEFHPLRCAVAPESIRAKRILRHLLHGGKPHVYRVIYEVDELQKVVPVLTIRQGAMEPAEL